MEPTQASAAVPDPSSASHQFGSRLQKGEFKGSHDFYWDYGIYQQETTSC